MKQITLILAIVLLSQSFTVGQTSTGDTFDLAIKNVDIFDSKSKQVLKDKTILISGDTIASIVDSSQRYTASKTIKGNGKLVVPGFIDTHTHLLQTYGKSEINVPEELADEVLEAFKKLTARQYLSKGVTTIVDMAQPEGFIEKSVVFQKNPTPQYPNYFINGSSTISDLSWDRTPPAHHEKIFSAEDGRKKVQKYARLGIKHMKLYWKLEEADMKAVVDEANKYGITLNAHVDNNIVTIPQAMDLGVKNFEHFFTVIPSILNFREESAKFNKKFGLEGNWNIDKFAANMTFHFKYIEDNDELNAKLMNLFDRMAKEKVSISTALNVLATAAERSDTFSTFDPIPPRNKPQTNYSKIQKKQLSEAFDLMMKYMKAAHEKGVKLRIGTDTRYGGDAFISELLLFGEAGFLIEDILQIATLNGAEAMKIEDRFGSIEVGKKADLVIFEKNPLDNYKNFQSAKNVIKGGKLFELQESAPYVLLERIEAKGLESGLKWFSKNKNNSKYSKFDEAEMNEIIFQLFAKGKVTEAIAVSRLSKQIFPKSINVYNDLNEDQLNTMGYNYLGRNQNIFAIEIFKLNAELNPKSANAYDSLGESYLKVENKELALKNYKKSVELNPNNFNAVNVINKIEGRKIKVDNSTLESYVGKYQINPKLLFTISKDGEKIFWQQKGRESKLELIPVSNERFVFAGTNESVLFDKAKDGKSKGLTLDQNGRLTKLNRTIPKTSEEDAVRIPLNNYLEGHKTRNAEYIKKAFHTEGKLIFIRDGKYTTWDFQDYIGRFGGEIAPDEDERTRTIESIDITGNAAIAKLVLDYPTTRYVDYASLLKINGEWKIVSKVFYAEPKTKTAGINKLKNKADSQKFDKVFSDFMQKYDIPGLSIAFSKDGETIYASGYGFADLEKKEKVTNNNRFRIASISKPITSVSILKLIEKNKLSLDDKVFGNDGIFKGKYLKKKDVNIEAINIRHLLQHTATPVWSNQGNTPDPMFVHLNLSQDELIRRTLKERAVTSKPGSKHAYSNFGYMILGRVIEQVSGKTYETFVNDLISEYDIKSFVITGDGGTPRIKNETAYYNGNPPALYSFPNGFPAARMDAHGGWIASAVDLVKFGELVDGVARPKDILLPKTIKMMKEINDVSTGYGFGWAVDKDGNISHSGSLPGTASTLTVTNNGMTWAILTNARSDADGFYDELENLMWKITRDIEL